MGISIPRLQRNAGITHGGVTLLGLLSVAGEDNQSCLVGLKTLNVQSLALLAQVSPPVVNNDTNTTSLLLANTSLLQLGEGEATALTDFPVVSDSLGTDGGAEESKGTDTKLSSLGLAGCATTELAAGLVEPGANTELPILAEVVLVED